MNKFNKNGIRNELVEQISKDVFYGGGIDLDLIEHYYRTYFGSHYDWCIKENGNEIGFEEFVELYRTECLSCFQSCTYDDHCDIDELRTNLINWTDEWATFKHILYHIKREYIEKYSNKEDEK